MAIADLIQNDRYSSSIIRDLLVHARRPDVISLAGGLPAETALPVERVAVTLQKILTERGTTALQYGLTSGEPELQEQLALNADYPTKPDEIVVTAGSQQALDLTIRVLSSDDRSANIAVVEDPGYLGALQALRSHCYTLVPIPVDQDGIRVDQLEVELESGLRPRLCYINPSFQNPTGASLSSERAIRLVALAEKYNFVILADDPYVELHLDGERATPLPESDMVARLGSASKTLSPGLRVGWLNAPPDLASAVALAKQPADLQTSTINQLLVAELMSDQGWWDSHTNALRSDYYQRRLALRQALRRHLPKVEIAEQGGGFFLWVTLPATGLGEPATGLGEPATGLGEPARVPVDTMDLLPKAVENGMAFVPGDAFTVGSKQPNTLRLSYSSGDPALFDQALRSLSITLNQARTTNQSPQGTPLTRDTPLTRPRRGSVAPCSERLAEPPEPVPQDRV